MTHLTPSGSKFSTFSFGPEKGYLGLVLVAASIFLGLSTFRWQFGRQRGNLDRGLISTLVKIGEARDGSNPTSAPSEDTKWLVWEPERVHRTQIPPETTSNEKVSGASSEKKVDFFRQDNFFGTPGGCQKIFGEKVKFSLFSQKCCLLTFEEILSTFEKKLKIDPRPR